MSPDLDLDVLTGAMAARLRLLPDVTRLYPARRGLDAVVRTVGGLLDAVADDPAVVMRSTPDGWVVELTVGVADGVPAARTAERIREEIRGTAAAHRLPVHRIRVRIASVD